MPLDKSLNCLRDESREDRWTDGVNKMFAKFRLKEIVRNFANTWRKMTPFCKQICWQNSAENFRTTATKARQRKNSRNFANKSLTEKFYVSLVHFLRGGFEVHPGIKGARSFCFSHRPSQKELTTMHFCAQPYVYSLRPNDTA